MTIDVNSVCGFIDNDLAELIHTAITILKIGIPVLLIIFGMLDFGKGVIANKEDEIKSGQHIFIKRTISAALVFFVVTIVQLLINVVDDKNIDDQSDTWNCANLILNGNVGEVTKITTSSDDNGAKKIELVCEMVNQEIDLQRLMADVNRYVSNLQCNSKIYKIGAKEIRIRDTYIDNGCISNEEFVKALNEIKEKYQCKEK